MPKTTMEDATTLSVRLRKETVRKVKEQAEKAGVSDSRVMRDIIEDYYSFMDLPAPMPDALRKDCADLGEDPNDIRGYLRRLLVARYDEVQARAVLEKAKEQAKYDKPVTFRSPHK